jgi:hypothetical protein
MIAGAERQPDASELLAPEHPADRLLALTEAEVR